jgi:hypothetical protein
VRWLAIAATLACCTPGLRPDPDAPPPPVQPDEIGEPRVERPRPEPTADSFDEATLGPKVSGSVGEVIVIRERRPTAVAAEPRPHRLGPPPYSDRAAVTNRWARAWLLLDIDRNGRVSRLKFLNRPGYDLDDIALREAFKTRFEPARDAAGRPTATYLLYALEWPSYWWMIKLVGTVTNRVRPAGYVPCRGSGPLNLDMAVPVYRDCSPPDLSRIRAARWIPSPSR